MSPFQQDCKLLTEWWWVPGTAPGSVLWTAPVAARGGMVNRSWSVRDCSSTSEGCEVQRNRQAGFLQPSCEGVFSQLQLLISSNIWGRHCHVWHFQMSYFTLNCVCSLFLFNFLSLSVFQPFLLLTFGPDFPSRHLPCIGLISPALLVQSLSSRLCCLPVLAVYLGFMCTYWLACLPSPALGSTFSALSLTVVMDAFYKSSWS